MIPTNKYRNDPKFATILRKSRSLRSLAKLSRDGFPTRGVFRKDPGLSITFYEEIWKLLEQYIAQIANSTLAKEYHTGELFQKSAKGPVGPIPHGKFVKEVVPLLRSGSSIPATEIAKFENLFTEVGKQFQKGRESYDPRSINFEDAGKTLPNSTSRGFPYFAKGKFVDQEIIKEGGASLDKAVVKFTSLDELICNVGIRITGKERPKTPKIRPIMVPAVWYQYLLNGLVTHSAAHLKSFTTFSGGLDEHERQRKIDNMIRKYSHKYVFMELDFSKFDQNVQPELRSIVASTYLTHKDISTEVLEKYKELMGKQHIGVVDESGDPTVISSPYKLLSGVKNTQHDGSLINLTLQQAILKHYRSSFNPETSLALGDDVVIPIPRKIYEAKGKEEILKDIKDIVGKFGFEVNADKYYPSDNFIFLQKLYSQDGQISAQGSGMRATGSFLGPEKYRDKVEGIKSIMAFDGIVQITIMKEAFSLSRSSLLDGFAERFAETGLKYDKELKKFVEMAKGKGLGPNELFKALIGQAAVDVNTYLLELDAQSYDHKGLAEAFSSEEYSNIFPILPALMRVVQPRQHKSISLNVTEIHESEGLSELVE